MGVLAAGAGAWFKDPLLELSAGFVRSLGGPGVALAYWVPDAFTVPLPSDALGLMGLAGGMSFVEVVAWGFGGSLAGGVTGYLVGRRLSRSRWIRATMRTRGDEVKAMVERYGVVALATAALTPLPYSIVCWASGALNMRFSTFFAVSLLRVARVAGYLWVVHTGFVSLQ